MHYRTRNSILSFLRLHTKISLVTLTGAVHKWVRERPLFISWGFEDSGGNELKPGPDGGQKISSSSFGEVTKSNVRFFSGRLHFFKMSLALICMYTCVM